jgi:hypothetical protein
MSTGISALYSEFKAALTEVLVENAVGPRRTALWGTLMPATPEATARTLACARVIGPFMVIVAGIITVRAPSMATELFAFFENPALVWVTGSMMLLGGLLIIAHHQYWSSLAAILISLFGWFVALRGLALLVAPQLYARGGTAAFDMMPIVQIGFGVLVLIGLWLTFVGWIAKPNH